jgi:hypothetical protein
MKLTEEQFYQMWCRYAKECKTKDDLRQPWDLPTFTRLRPAATG